MKNFIICLSLLGLTLAVYSCRTHEETYSGVSGPEDKSVNKNPKDSIQCFEFDNKKPPRKDYDHWKN